MNQDDSQRRIEELTRIVLRPIASPVPFAFFAFGIGVLLQSSLQLGLLPPQANFDIALILGVFVFPAMSLATIFAFLSRETLGATVMGLISLTWLSIGVVKFATFPNPTSGALGVLVLLFAFVLVLLAAGAASEKPALAVVLVLAATRFGVNGFYELTGSGGVQFAAGIIGILVGLAAFYVGLAFGIEDLQQRAVLPIGRGGGSDEAFQGDVSEQVGTLGSEAGVRKQL